MRTFTPRLGIFILILFFIGCAEESSSGLPELIGLEEGGGEEGGSETPTGTDVTGDAGATDTTLGGAKGDAEASVGDGGGTGEGGEATGADAEEGGEGAVNDGGPESDGDTQGTGEGGDGSGLLPSTCETSSDCVGLQVCGGEGECEEPPVCLSNDDCLNQRVCSRGRCADEPFGCQSDAECFGGYCNSFTGKCTNAFPCLDQSGCATGVCTGTECVDCLAQEDCPVPSVQQCINQACVEPEVCSADSDCLGGNVCFAGGCQAPVPIADEFEPNDEAQSAPVLPSEGAAGLTLEAGTVDWYRIATLPGISPLIRVDFDDTYDGVLQVNLYEANTGVLVSSGGGLAPFAVVGAKGQDGESMTLFLEIVHVSGVVPTYDITVFLSEKGFCLNDGFDQAGTSDTKDASPVLAGPEVSLDGLLICEGDVDWFQIVSNSDFNLVGAVVYPYMPNGELRISFQQGDQEVHETLVGKNGDLEFVLEGLEPGTWYIKVEGEGTVQSAYRLDLNIGESGLCIPDSKEPNNTAEESFPLESGVSLALSLCDGDEDWFLVEVPDSLGATFTVDYGNSVLPVEAHLFAPDGEPAGTVEAEDLGGAQRTTVTLDPVALGGGYLLRVVHAEEGVGLPVSPYTLTVEVALEPCTEEDGEDNGTLENATSVPVVGIPLDGGFCSPDYADWYAIDLAPGERVSLEVAYGVQYGSLLMHLYDPSGNYLMAVGNTSVAGGGVIGMDVPLWWWEGTYYLLLTGEYNGNYDLLVQKKPPALCPEEDEATEPNNTPLSAITGTVGVQVELGLCTGDPDVVGWVVEAAQSYVLSVESSNPGPWADGVLTDAWGTVLAEVELDGPVVTVEISADDITGAAIFFEAESGLGQSVTVTLSTP